eukprot:COSAG06_NODE_1176_length_10405_cov_6045.623751_6_plen_103_part_00
MLWFTVCVSLKMPSFGIACPTKTFVFSRFFLSRFAAVSFTAVSQPFLSQPFRSRFFLSRFLALARSDKCSSFENKRKGNPRIKCSVRTASPMAVAEGKRHFF